MRDRKGETDIETDKGETDIETDIETDRERQI